VVRGQRVPGEIGQLFRARGRKRGDGGCVAKSGFTAAAGRDSGKRPPARASSSLRVTTPFSTKSVAIAVNQRS